MKKPIPFAPGYHADDMGNVWHGSRPLRGWMRSGYRVITFPGRVRIYVHQIIAVLFHGQPNAGLEVRHDDGNPLNNSADNLLWGTHAENMADMVRHGRSMLGRKHPYRRRGPSPLRGSKHPRSVLTETDIPRVLARLATGESQRSIAQSFGVSRSLVRNIKLGKAWGHHGCRA